MKTEVSTTPKGYHSLTPYLMVKDADKAIEFYKKVFGATEKFRIDGPKGKVGHCELQIGDSRIMLADDSSKKDSPNTNSDSSVSILVYVENVDEIFKKATDAGAKVLRPLQDEFYGDRMGTLCDPFGHIWNLATHIEDVSSEEMQKRAQKMWQ